MVKNYFAHNLKTFRLEQGWTQEQLAEKLNVHANTIGSYERGVSEPGLSVLLGVAKMTGISIEDFCFVKFLKEE